jgi:hypothetical protein
MNDFESVAKQFHRKAPLTVAQKDADFSKKDKEQAKQKLKEETKGETLGEWFNKKQKEADADLISQDELPAKSQPGGKGDHPDQKKEFQEERKQERAENRAERSSERKRY